MGDIVDSGPDKKNENPGWNKAMAIVWSVIGLAVLIGFIIVLPELEIFNAVTSAGSKEIQAMLKIKLQYYAIIIIVVCLTIGICIILYLSMSGSREMDQARKLEFSLKYVAIAIIANAAFMLGILDGSKDTIDKIITLYAGIAGYVLGSASAPEPKPKDENQNP